LNVKQTTIVIFLALIPLLFFQNCGKPTELEYSSSMDLSSEAGVQNAAIQILNKHCAECHSATNMNGNVGDLTNIEYLTYTRLVVPGEPELSPIINQITQGLMPAGRPALSGTEVEILKDWIKALNEDELGPGTGLPAETVIDPKYSVLASQIFSPRCITCHAGRNYKLNSYNELLRVVTPGDAANSLLYKAITVGATGGKMPQGGALSSAQIKAIQDWINSGAPNN
jgi:mono/diheme cytochrome c family protein